MNIDHLLVFLAITTAVGVAGLLKVRLAPTYLVVRHRQVLAEVRRRARVDPMQGLTLLKSEGRTFTRLYAPVAESVGELGAVDRLLLRTWPSTHIWVRTTSATRETEADKVCRSISGALLRCPYDDASALAETANLLISRSSKAFGNGAPGAQSQVLWRVSNSE